MTCGSTLSGPALEDQHGPTSAPNVRLWTRLMAWDTRISALMHAVERELQSARAFCCPSGLVYGPLGSGQQRRPSRPPRRRGFRPGSDLMSEGRRGRTRRWRRARREHVAGAGSCRIERDAGPHRGHDVAVDDPHCRAAQPDRVLTAVKARRCAPPPLRGADGLDTGCAHGRQTALARQSRNRFPLQVAVDAEHPIFVAGRLHAPRDPRSRTSGPIGPRGGSRRARFAGADSRRHRLQTPSRQTARATGDPRSRTPGPIGPRRGSRRARRSSFKDAGTYRTTGRISASPDRRCRLASSPASSRYRAGMLISSRMARLRLRNGTHGQAALSHRHWRQAPRINPFRSDTRKKGGHALTC